MFFRDILGHEEVKHQLIQSVKTNRIPHAQLFLSKEGAGALPLALAYMSYIYCLNREEHDSCGDCSACHKTHKYIHPDVHFSYPVVKYKDMKREVVTSDMWLKDWRMALDKHPFMNLSRWLVQMDAEGSQPNINVKECNDLRSKLSMTTYESETKLLIMWLPEYLEKEGNRLLKLIEEPTDDTYIILVSENQQRILKTILSRCQVTNIKGFRIDEVKTYLVQNFELSEMKATQIANLTQGDIEQAINMANGEDVEYSELTLEWLRHAWTLKPESINQTVTKVGAFSKDDQKSFFEYNLHFLRQYIYWHSTKRPVPLTDMEMAALEKISSILTIDKAERISSLINETIYHIQRNASLKIGLFADSLTIGKILREK
jgi:DNA polymerase III subunit delta'